MTKGKSLIYHLAASATTKESSSGWNDPIFDPQVNQIGTVNQLMAMKAFEGEPLLVFTSSAAVYGNPIYTLMDGKHM